MGFKPKQKNKTFSDLEKSADKKNKALFTLMELDKAISWGKIEAALLRDYPVGQKKEGNKAYSPLFLFKCLLLQKWYQIKSDPELESQINDRESFQTFLKLSSQEKSPDHSTFSIFRKRLTREKFDIIVGDILNQFAEKGLSINEGIAVDARIVRSASKPVSNRTLEKIRKERPRKVFLIKTEIQRNFKEILNPTGPRKTTSIIMVSKSMHPLMPNTGLCFQPS